VHQRREVKRKAQNNQVDVITGALALGHDALAAFAPGESPVLWPEHFDVAIRVHDVNFGVSPGDGFIEEPVRVRGTVCPACRGCVLERPVWRRRAAA
jgi:hypothetical protein